MTFKPWNLASIRPGCVTSVELSHVSELWFSHKVGIIICLMELF